MPAAFGLQQRQYGEAQRSIEVQEWEAMPVEKPEGLT